MQEKKQKMHGVVNSKLIESEERKSGERKKRAGSEGKKSERAKSGERRKTHQLTNSPTCQLEKTNPIAGATGFGASPKGEGKWYRSGTISPE